MDEMKPCLKQNQPPKHHWILPTSLEIPQMSKLELRGPTQGQLCKLNSKEEPWRLENGSMAKGT